MSKIKIKQNNEKVISEVLKRFQKHNKSKNLSQKPSNTIVDVIKNSLNIQRNTILTIERYKQNLLENYSLYLQKKDISENSVNSYLRGIRRFLYYAMVNSWLDDFKISTIKTTERKLKGYMNNNSKNFLKSQI